jgi:uncharacterized protein (TIGR03067 family)
MRMPLSAALTALLIAGCASRDNSDGKPGLEGKWEVVAVEWDGETRDPGAHRELTLTGDKWVWTFTNPRSTVAGTYRIDPTTTPAAIDMTTTEGVAAGAVTAGIFMLDGDMLKLAFAPKGTTAEERPREFGDAGVTVLILQRKK